MAKLFDSIRMSAPKRNKFDLSHERKFSFNMGDLVPIMCQEIVPGDSFRVNTELMMRLAPMLAPIMHRVNVKTEFFFVPNRIVWDEWEDFITGGEDGQLTPIPPHLLLDEASRGTYLNPGSLPDYMGVPIASDPIIVPLKFSALPFRAYATIYNDYYRDQNVQPKLVISKASGEVVGADVDVILQLRKRAWEKDYFTSALPFAQRGPAVDIPMQGTGSVVYKNPATFESDAPGYDPDIAATFRKIPTAPDINAVQGGIDYPGTIENIEEVSLDSSGVTINDLRRSIRLQEWLEKMARGGARYVELLRNMFGVRSSDARLQRPEFLGGATTPVRISEVLSTVQQVDDAGDPIGTPQGDMSGHGVSVGNQNGFKHFFEEHGYVIGVVSCLPRTAYMQCMPRHLTRVDKYDYYWQQFANIGEQAVLNKEVYYNYIGSVDSNNATFGYQSRYAEYKYGYSSVHGDFQSSLLFWHMARKFATTPGLNENFIKADPTHRIFAVDDPAVHKLWCHLYHKVDAMRPMPYFGTPTL